MQVPGPNIYPEVMVTIQKIRLPIAGMDLLHAEARDGGYKFIDTLVEDWANGKNRFEAPGELLCGHLDQGLLVAVGGLTVDPFLARSDTGRIRRVFVRPGWRNRGVGRALLIHLIDHARENFQHVRLRAENDDAARLYERLGFAAINDPDATHILSFK